MTSEKPDLQKLRRFALTIGLILITYGLAGVMFAPGETVRPLGLPLIISDTGLVSIGLVLASFYSAARFFYYGVLMSDTPKQTRRRLWNAATTQIESNHPNKEILARNIGELDGLYPKGYQVNPIFQLNSETLDVEEGKIDIAYHRRALASLHDIDYWAPVWFNVVAVVFSIPDSL